MSQLEFAGTFEKLTGYPPFPWQQALYARFAEGDIPDACTLPTGLGKTSVIAVWLIALANGKPVPRRLVYVVNRRTVVDQTTDEAVKYRQNAEAAGVPKPAISTLRGQYADNREWSADPSRPAIICGTVDMIGSRLLFSGYGVGFKGKPLHAGFLGQDVLLVHDEAHLEPAFQELIVAIRKEQERCKEFRPFRVMELTATSRSGGEVFPDKGERKRNEADAKVKLRIGAEKHIEFFPADDEKAALVKEIVTRAKVRASGDAAVLVFVRSVERAGDIAKQLGKEFPKSVEQLTGTLRGYERDALVKKPVFQRFLPPSNRDTNVSPAPGTVFLVCTSAGEVGVNISADHLVCDLSTFDSMAQRFGRVNRFGTCPDTRIDIVHPKAFGNDDKLDETDRRRKRTLEVLKKLDRDGSPRALGEVHRKAMQEGSGTEPMSTDQTKALRDYILATYAPPPTILPTSDILFDAWALTTVRELPSRPPVAEYLHGIEDEKQRETHVAWREEVELFDRFGITGEQIGELLDGFPLRPHELLRDVTWRIQNELANLVKGREDTPVWVIDPDETVRVLKLGRLAQKDKKGHAENLTGRTVVLPPSAGGLTATGILSGTAPPDPAREYDVAGLVPQSSGVPLVRLVITQNDGNPTYSLLATAFNLPEGLPFHLDGKKERARLQEIFVDPPMGVAFRLDLAKPDAEDEEHGEYVVLKPESKDKVYKHEAAWPALDVHNRAVGEIAGQLCERLVLPAEVSRAVRLAAGWHDLGKGRRVWQLGAGNRRGCMPVAKTLHGRPPENLNHFRHELGSMIDACGDPGNAGEVAALDEPTRELTLHLIAAHHGRARPHFPERETDDPERPAVAAASVVEDTPGRFARLQRRYGRWGLAYLESLVRAADALDSKRIEATPIGEEEPGTWPSVPAGFTWPARKPRPEPTIRVAVDATNPGQFFACCGLLELADRLWPDGAEGWFADNGRQFHMTGTKPLAELVQAIATAEVTLLDEGDIYSGRVTVGIGERPFVLDWWHELGGRKDAKDLKVWAGTMESYGIARAMQRAMRDEQFGSPDLLNVGMVVSDADDAKKKKEPYYFDARRAPNAHSRDVGFSANDLGLTTTAFPAVEFLCLVGLQRCLPQRNGDTRIYDYFTWSEPLVPALLPSVVPGLVPCVGARGYRFENWFRTGQRKHKAFRPATPVPIGGAQ